MRFVSLAACAVLANSMFPWALSAQEATPRPAKVFTVPSESAELTWQFPAITFPSQEVEVSFRVSGQVLELPILASMDVVEGDVLAQLDTRDYETQVAQLESQRDQALAQLEALRTGSRPEEIAVLEAAVASAAAQVEQARQQFERTQRLTQTGTATAAQLEQDQANLSVAAAQLETQREQLAIGRAGGREEDIRASEAALRGLESQLQSARDNLSDATLKAPFSGTIARRDIENFANIQAGQSIALLQNLSTVDVVFDIPGTDVSEIAEAGVERVSSVVIFDALPDQVFDTELVEFSTQADAATQTYRGRVAVEIPEDATILPGMVARVIAKISNNGPSAPMVPLTAVGAAPDGATFVWILNPETNAVSQRPVSLGDMSGANIAVTEGIEYGDTVISAGVSYLQDGMVVRPITQIGG